MGLIKAAAGAIGSTFKDQWKEVISCENMTNDVLMVEKTTETGVITNKSLVVVAPGQCAIIIENGRVMDATAEDGAYTFDASSSPSFFAGQFGAVFKEMWQRFTFGGATAKKQAVYFINLKEIIDNRFGTPSPIPFQDWAHPIQNQMTGTQTPMRVQIKCFGKYTFKICDPALFMQEIAGTASIYRKDQLVEQLRAEVLATFQNITNELGTSEYKVPALEMPSQTDEIKMMMDQKVFDEPMRRRGIAIVGFAVESVTLDEESEKKIDQYEISVNQFMQQGTLVSSYGRAMEKAAENENGAMNGFMGIGMMNNMAGGKKIMGSVFSQDTENSRVKEPAPAPAPEPVPEVEPEPVVAPAPEEKTADENPDLWICGCGQDNKGKFCVRCGKPKTAAEIKEKYCPNCGKIVPEGSNFCGECGMKVK